MKITVARLEREIHEGDWHDAPSRWNVTGPGTEVQRFSRKVDALAYARVRRASPDFYAAVRAYAS